MSSDVRLEIVFVLVLTAADFTRCSRCGDVESFEVITEMARSSERFLTELALIWLDTFVHCQDVPFEDTFQHELLAAETGNGRKVGVLGIFMNLKRTSRDEHCRAVGA